METKEMETPKENLVPREIIASIVSRERTKIKDDLKRAVMQGLSDKKLADYKKDSIRSGIILAITKALEESAANYPAYWVEHKALLESFTPKSVQNPKGMTKTRLTAFISDVRRDQLEHHGKILANKFGVGYRLGASEDVGEEIVKSAKRGLAHLVSSIKKKHFCDKHGTTNELNYLTMQVLDKMQSMLSENISLIQEFLTEAESLGLRSECDIDYAEMKRFLQTLKDEGHP